MTARRLHEIRHEQAMEAFYAELHPNHYVHGIEVGTAMYHPERSARDLGYAALAKYSWEHMGSIEHDEMQAYSFGVLSGISQPLGEVDLDLGVKV